MIIAEYLRGLDWPDPIIADSGNGGHLLYAIDLPVDDDGIIQRVLAALATRFDDSSVKVDKSVYNPARICKLYGTLAGKGDSTDDQPNRMARILSIPESINIVPREKLEALAAQAPTDAKKAAARDQNASKPRFDLDDFINRHLPDVTGPESWKGEGRRWVLPQSPMCDHHDGAAFICQLPEGAISAGCQHSSCSWKWPDLREKFEPRASRNGHQNGNQQANTVNDEPVELPKPVGIATLISDHPQLSEPIIDGLIRRGETANIIAAPKVGKSWLAYALALCIAMGYSWLGRFLCRRGRVLLIDNELHPNTLANRIPLAAGGISIRQEEYVDNLDVITLRGRLTDLYGIDRILEPVETGRYDLVILDALYRALPANMSENDNATMAMLFNKIDQITERLGCAWVNIHHAAKGEQGQKAITDVGAGAGAQSRAADAHIVLRQHDEDGAVVLEAVVRSFPPVEPLPLRWTFPVWRPDESLDPTKVRGRMTKQEERQSDKDKDGVDKLRAALAKGPATMKVLRGITGLSKGRVERLLDVMESKGEVAWTEIKKRGNECREYRIKPEAEQEF